METNLQWRVLESPWPATLVLLAMSAAAGLVWRRYRRSAWLYAAGGLMLAAAGAWLLTTAVLTPREQIARAIDRMARSAERNDLSTLHDVVDSDYDDGRYDRDALLALAVKYFRDYPVSKVAISELQVEPAGGLAQARFRATVTVEIPILGRELPVPTTWTTQWIRRQQGGKSVWRLRSARLEEPADIADAPGKV